MNRTFIDVDNAVFRVVANDGPEGLENFVHRIGLSGQWYAAGQVSNERLATCVPAQLDRDVLPGTYITAAGSIVEVTLDDPESHYPWHGIVDGETEAWCDEGDCGYDDSRNLVFRLN